MAEDDEKQWKNSELQNFGITKLREIASNLKVKDYTKYKKADIDVLIKKILKKQKDLLTKDNPVVEDEKISLDKDHDPAKIILGMELFELQAVGKKLNIENFRNMNQETLTLAILENMVEMIRI